MDAQGNVEQYDPLASSCVAETVASHVGYITLRGDGEHRSVSE